MLQKDARRAALRDAARAQRPQRERDASVKNFRGFDPSVREASAMFGDDALGPTSDSFGDHLESAPAELQTSPR